MNAKLARGLDATANSAQVLGRAEKNAGHLEHNQSAPRQGEQPGLFDVWKYTGEGLSSSPDRHKGSIANAYRGMSREWSSGDSDKVAPAMSAMADTIGQQAAAVGKAEGVLPKIGATFELLTSVEELLSMPLSVIPFPAFPALRIMDMDVGLPHAHMHPPNLTPPNPVPVPLPSTGPVIPIPFLSGASKTLINNMPAARCGDMGLGIWCGGYFPMYEVFLGSSNVWIEGARAARMAVDITKHCIFSSPRPNDPPLGPMIGTTIQGSPNVSIGGVPMPSLLNLAMGAAVKGLFAGVGKLARKFRADKIAKEAGENSIRAFSRSKTTAFWKTLAMHPIYGLKIVGRSYRMLGRMFLNLFRRRNFGTLMLKSFDEYVEGQRIINGLFGTGALRFSGRADAAFIKGTMDDLSKIASTSEGKKLLYDLFDNKLRRNSQVTLEPAAGHPSYPRPHYQPYGNSAYDFVNNKPGTPSSGRVAYNPGKMGRNVKQSPSDATLFHELEHANTSGRGEDMADVKLSDPAENARWSNLEEQNTIARENKYRTERGLPHRDGHDDLP